LEPLRHVALVAALIAAAACSSVPRKANPGIVTLGPEVEHLHPYFTQVQERIGAKWAYPPSAAESRIEGDVRIEFYIAKDGSLALIEVRHSSRVPALDEAALTAVKRAQPFPPVTDEVAKQTLAIDSRFRYRIERNQRRDLYRPGLLPTMLKLLRQDERVASKTD
jgi:TonB family protein